MRLGFSTLIHLMILFSMGQSQTIHRDDLDYFVGAFKRADSSGKQAIDVTHFEKYFVTGDNDRRKGAFDSVKCGGELHWVYDWRRLSSQNGEVRCGSGNRYGSERTRELRFYIMMDFCGHELQENVLTVWEEVNCDSLKYIGGQAGPFNSSIGSARVKYVTVFPDSSILLIVEYGGEGYGGTGFFRGAAPNEFRQFHYKERRFDWESYREGEYTDIEFDLYRLLEVSSSYEVMEKSMYKTVVPDSSKRYGEHFIITIDSTAVRSVDLWRLAKEQLKIGGTE